jgi:hypothetical protein
MLRKDLIEQLQQDLAELSRHYPDTGQRFQYQHGMLLSMLASLMWEDSQNYSRVVRHLNRLKRRITK